MSINKRTVIKLILNLLLIAGFVDLIRRGYILFTRHDPVKSTIIFLVELGVWLLVIHLLRQNKYKYQKPSFKLTTACVVIIFLVCAFADIEPLYSYKNTTLGFLTNNTGNLWSKISINSSEPSGTYSATIFGIQQSLTFKSDTLEIYNVIDGKRIFQYTISKDGNNIRITNVATRQTTTESFSFIKEYQIVVLSGIEYHHK